MTKKLKISVSYDDLSEDIKAEIESLRSQGYIVEIEWPGAKAIRPNYPLMPDDWKLPPITCSSKSSNKKSSNKTNVEPFFEDDDSISKFVDHVRHCLHVANGLAKY